MRGSSGVLRSRKWLALVVTALFGAIVIYAVSTAATAIPVPSPIVMVHTESGSVTRDIPVPVGGVPVPIDVDNGTLLGLLCPDVDVSVGLVSLPDLPNILVPSITIARDPLAVIRHAPSPPLKISARVVIINAATLSNLATVDYGYETPPGGKIPPIVKATLTGPLAGGFVDPLKARLESPGYRGPLKFNIKVTTPSLQDTFALKFDPLPETINITEAPRSDGLDFTYDHSGPTDDVKLDATADLRDPGSGELKHIGATVERLPNHLQASYTQTSAGTALEYFSGSDLGKPDIEATYRDTLGNGTIVNDGDARISGLPSHIKATIASRSNPDGTADIDGVNFGVLDGGQIDALDFEFKNFLTNPGNVPEYNLGSEQFVAMASKRQANGTSAYRATGHLLAVRGGAFSRTGPNHDKLAVSTNLGNGDLPLRGIVDLDNRGAKASEDPKRTKVDATIDPLPQKIDLTYQPSSDTDPTDIVYDFPVAPAKPVNADTTALIAKGPSSTCGDDRVICAQAAIDNIPLHLEAKLPGNKGTDFSVSHTGPATGTGRPNVRATIDVGPDSSQTPAKPRTWVQAALTGVPPEVRGRLDTHTGELTAAEFHGCDWDFTANPAGCVHAQNSIGSVDFLVRDQPNRVGLPPRPDTAKQYVTLISRQKAPEPKHFEVKGHVDQVRNVAFHQLDLVPNDNKTDGVLGAQVELGGAHSASDPPIPFDVAVDTLSDALGPKPDTGDAPVIGDDASTVNVHVDNLPPAFGACVRSSAEGAPPDLTGKPEKNDSLLAPCETAKVSTTDGEPAVTPLTANYTATELDGHTPFKTHVDAHVTSTSPDRGDLNKVDSSPFPVISDLDLHIEKVPASLHVDVIPPVTPDASADPVVKGRRLQVRYAASDVINSIKFALQQRRSTSICGDPRPNRKALCLSGTLANLPAGGDVSPTLVTFNPDDKIGDITIDTADTTPKLSLDDLNLSKVSPEDGATPIVVSGKIDDLPAHMTGKLQSLPIDGGELKPTVANPNPTMAQQFNSCFDGIDNNGVDGKDLSDPKCKKSLARLEFNACPNGAAGCAGVGTIDVTATNALVGDPVPHVPAPPPATSGHPDPGTPADGFSFVQSGDFFRARALIHNFQDLAYSKLDPTTGKASPVTALGAGLGSGAPLRAYLSRDTGTEVQKIDAIITNPPSKLGLCMRDKTDDANLGTSGDFCSSKDGNGDGANDAASSAIQLTATPNGVAPDIDVRSLTLSKGGGAELLTGHAFVGGLGDQIDILSGDNVLVEGHQSGHSGPADVANHVDFALSNFAGGSRAGFPWDSLQSDAVAPADDPRNNGNYLQFLKDADGRFTAIGSIPHVKQVGMSKAPCAPSDDTPAPNRFVDGHAPDYKCISANIGQHAPLGLAVRTLDHDGSILAVDDGHISSVPDSLAVTLAKVPDTDAGSPRCHDNLNTDSSGKVHCVPPMLSLVAPHDSGPAGTLEARLQTGKKVDLDPLSTASPDDVLSRRLSYTQRPADWGTYPSGSPQAGQEIDGARVSVGTDAATGDPAIQMGLRIKIPKYLDLDPFVSLSCTSAVESPIVGTSDCTAPSSTVGSSQDNGYKAQNILFRLVAAEDHPYGNPPASNPYLGRVALMINTVNTQDPQDQTILTGMPETVDNTDPVKPDGTGTGADSHYAENLPADGDPSQFGFLAPGHLDAGVYLRSDYNATNGDSGIPQTSYTQLDGRVNAPLTAALRLNQKHLAKPTDDPNSIFDIYKGSENRNRDHVPSTQITLRNEPGSNGTENYGQPTFRLRAELHSGFQSPPSGDPDLVDRIEGATDLGNLFTCQSQYSFLGCAVIPTNVDERYIDLQVNAQPDNSEPPARTIDVVGGPFGGKNNIEMRGFQNVSEAGPKGPAARFTPVAVTRLTNFNFGVGFGLSLGIIGAEVKFISHGDVLLGLAGHQVNDLRLSHKYLGMLAKSAGGASRIGVDDQAEGLIQLTLHLFWDDYNVKFYAPSSTQHITFTDCDNFLPTSVDNLNIGDGHTESRGLALAPSFSLSSLFTAPLQILGGLIGPIGCAFDTSDSALISDDNTVSAPQRDPAPTFDVPGHEVPGQHPQAAAAAVGGGNPLPTFTAPGDFGVPTDGHILCGVHKFKNVIVDGELDVGKTGQTDDITHQPCDGTLTIDAQSVDVTTNGKIVADGVIAGGGGKPSSGLGGGAGHNGLGGASGSGGAQGGSYLAPTPVNSSAPIPPDNGSEGAAGSDSVSGGLGGGTIRIGADSFTNDGTITALGGKGADATVETGGACKTGAGGGSGGTVEITANQLEGGASHLNPSAIDASGGPGGDGGFGGGGGSGGRVIVNAVAIVPSLAAAHGSGGGSATGFCDETATTPEQNPRAIGADGADGAISGDRVGLASTVRLHDSSTPLIGRSVPTLDLLAVASDTAQPVFFHLCRKTAHFTDANAFNASTDPGPGTSVGSLVAGATCTTERVDNPNAGTHTFELADYAPADVPAGVSGFFVYASRKACPELGAIDPVTDEEIPWQFVPGEVAAHQCKAQVSNLPHSMDPNGTHTVFHVAIDTPQSPLPSTSTARFGYDPVRPQITSVDLDGKAGCPQDSRCLTTPIGHTTIHAHDTNGPGSTAADDASGVALITCHDLTHDLSSGLWVGGPYQDCTGIPTQIALAEGLNELDASAYDAAGNVNDPNDPNEPAPPLKKWFVDTHNPSVDNLSLQFPGGTLHNGWRNVNPAVLVSVKDPGPASGFGDDAIDVEADGAKLTCGTIFSSSPDDGTMAVSKTCDTGTLSLSQGTHTYTAVVTDRAGRQSDPVDPKVSKLDTLPPSSDIFVGPTHPDGLHGWYKSPPFVAFSAADGPGGSGVNPADDTDTHPVGTGIHINIDNAGWGVYDPTHSYVLGDGTHRVCWYAIDVAGNREVADPNVDGVDDPGAPGGKVHCKTDIKVDTVAPVVTDPISPTLPNGNNGYYVSKPTITPNGSDPVPSPGTAISGIDRIEYQVDDGDWTLKAPIVVQAGIHTIRVRAFDNAGNAAAMHERTVSVDLTKPVGALFGYPPNPNGQGWFRQPRVDIVAARDERDGSGIDSASYLLDGGSHAYLSPFTVPVGPSHTASETPKDRAGNVGVASPTQTSKIDTTAPVPNPSPVAANTLTLLQTLLGSLLPALTPTTLAFTVTDDLSSRVKETVYIYNQFDALVKTIPVPGPYTGGYRDTGAGSVTWNGTNDAGKGVLPGVYHYRIEAIDQAGNSGQSTESLTFLVVLGLLPL